MTEKMIRDAYCRIRTIDQTIPDDVLDFMKDAALEKLRKHAVSGSLPLFKCKCGYETSNSVAWCTHADCCNGNDR